MLIVWALYRLWSSGAWCHDHLAATLQEAGIKACKTDTNLWMRPAVKADGSKYYEYILCYADNILIVLEPPKRIMEGMKPSTFSILGLSVNQGRISGPRSRSTNWNTPITRTRSGGACQQRTT
jgi:hypothetical protein